MAIQVDEKLLEKAWETRVQHFSHQITFVYPTNTEVLSVTGPNCELDCSHCGGHYLKHMKGVDEASCASSYLISGGCSLDGKIPLLDKSQKLRALSKTGRLNMHVGLVTRKEACEIGKLSDVVSFDFVGCNKTIAEVYDTNYTVEDYSQSYNYLKEYVQVVPHICIGLNGGAESGEFRALELLKEAGAEGISFIVFIPTPGTKFQDKTPPPLSFVIEVLARARTMFPRVMLHLGCMRPGGRYRNELDYWAVKVGINKIVIPAPAARKLVDDMGLEVTLEEACCSL